MNELTSNNVYHAEVATLKRYGEEFKLTLHKTLRDSGWEENNPDIWEPLEKKIKVSNEVKLQCNISRSKAHVMELALCNDWQFFFTGTLDPAKYDRTNLDVFKKVESQFIRDQRKKYKSVIDYILIPELHADEKSWHVHGLLNGLTPNMWDWFKPGQAPQKVIDAGYVNYPDFAHKFGWVTLGKIQNKAAISRYITKYITKNTNKTVKELYKNMYYCSQGLDRSQTIKKGVLGQVPPLWGFENDYVKIVWGSEQELMSYFL